MTDVINMIFMMMNAEPESKNSDEIIVQKIKTFVQICEEKLFNRLWIPKTHIHDSEVDDILCNLVLKWIHTQMGTELKTIVQLPIDNEKQSFESVEKAWIKLGAKVVRDPDSKNGKAVIKANKESTLIQIEQNIEINKLKR